MEGIKGINVFSLIFSLYRDPHIYTKIPHTKISNFPNLITSNPFDYEIV